MLQGTAIDEQELLQAISIFRQITIWLLEQFCQKIDLKIDYLKTWVRLIRRKIFVHSGVFWKDGIVVQVLARQLEILENDRYRRFHGIALELWEEYLRKIPEPEWQVNALRNIIYHAVNSDMTRDQIAQRIAAALRSIPTASPETWLELYRKAEFKEEDLEDEHRWFEYLEIRHKERPSADEIEQFLKLQAKEMPASHALTIESKLLDALARALDFLRQNAENVLRERWEKRNLGKAKTPPIFEYSKEPNEQARLQEIKQSLQQDLSAIPGSIRLDNGESVMLDEQYLEDLQTTMLNAQKSIGRLTSKLAMLASLKEKAELEQEIDGYKKIYDDAAAELAEIYVHLYSPQ